MSKSMDKGTANVTAHILLANLEAAYKLLIGVLTDSQLDFDHPKNGTIRKRISEFKSVIDNAKGRMT